MVPRPDVLYYIHALYTLYKLYTLHTFIYLKTGILKIFILTKFSFLSFFVTVNEQKMKAKRKV